MKTEEYAPTYTADIEIAGDIVLIKQACRQFCAQEGEGKLCVRITEADFVYSGSSQTGATVHLINYPRFPSKPSVIRKTAIKLAEYLMHWCTQRSCSVVCSDDTILLKNETIPIV